MARVFANRQDPELIEMIRSGAVGILPTDTVYGIVASAKNPQAVAKMYELKRRERKPGTTIASSVEQLRQLGLDATRLERVERFWPGPLSVVMPQGESLEYLHQGVGDSPFRVVDDPVVQQLLQQTGPLVTSSANQPGKPPATNLAQAQAYFDDQVDYYVDGGETGECLPSTIVRLQDNGKLQILRQGTIHISQEDQI